MLLATADCLEQLKYMVIFDSVLFGYVGQVFVQSRASALLIVLSEDFPGVRLVNALAKLCELLSCLFAFVIERDGDDFKVQLLFKCLLVELGPLDETAMESGETALDQLLEPIV